jgi:TonB family protein
MEGSANAVAKLANGEIYNITGVLASSTKLDLAILNAEVKKVPFLVLSKTTKPDADAPVAMIGSALAGAEGASVRGTFSAGDSDENEGEIKLAASVPAISLGAPVVDQSGEIVGVVTAPSEKGEASSIVRPISAVKSVVTEIGSNATARWPGETRPSPTPRPRLVSMQRPIYPSEARFHDGIARSGRYRVNFDANGTVKNIQVLQTTGSDVLDHAAIAGLQQWKCEPGREGFVVVPLTFQSR